MKKSQLFACCSIFAAFTLISCGQDSAEIGLDWSNHSSGNLEVVNTSNVDMVLFVGDRPTDSGLMGGVKAGTTRVIDICKYVPDCNVGGWVIIKGITRDIYNENVTNLTGITKIDFSAMATYKGDQRYRIAISREFMGSNAVRLVNRGRVGMELRKDSPEGEKVAYLPAFQQNQLLWTTTTSDMTLFPFYVLYNSTTQSVTTLKATDIGESVQISPRAVSGDPASSSILTYYLPNADDSWDKIVGTLKSPVAYIKVTNNVMNQSAYFTVAGSNRLTSQNGYDGIGSGESLVFEVKAESEEDGGAQKALMAMYYGGTDQVAIRFNDEDGNQMTTAPIIYNGYDYTVSITGSRSEGYKGTITKGTKRDLSGQLESL